MPANVMLTSAGRRTTLLGAFKEAAHRRGGQAFAADMDPLAPALFLADRGLRLPPVSDPEYLAQLYETVERHGISLVVPTIDPELPVLASAARSLSERGCHALISSPELLSVAGDKWETMRAARACGLRTPRSWLPGQLDDADLPERLFLKPRNGSASQNACAVHRDDLMELMARVPHPIIQEEIEAPEVTIDALLDLSGRPLHYVPRQRLRTLAGESIQGVTLPDARLREWIVQALDLVGSLGGRGPVTLQAFLTNEGPMLSEINPRFGGGFPLTLAAGGDYPEWIIRMLMGERVAPRLGDYTRHLYMTRYYVELIRESPLWQ